jgi:hypothetical protein
MLPSSPAQIGLQPGTHPRELVAVQARERRQARAALSGQPQPHDPLIVVVVGAALDEAGSRRDPRARGRRPRTPDNALTPR